MFIENPKLWYNAFKAKYPVWSHKVNYISNSHHLIDWKDFVIHLNKQQKSTQHFSFEFVNEHYCSSRKRKRIVPDQDLKPPFWIQDPLVVDIDRITKTGVVATGKHRKNASYHVRSEHKILFWEYPSWKLIRVFELNLQPPTLTCQIIGIQSIRMLSNDNTPYKVRFFSLAVGMTLMNGIDTDNEDRVDIWKSLFIYRLNDDGSTQCMAHLKINDLFLGREVFLFSDTSWCQSSDGDDFTQDTSVSKLQDWMKITLPNHQDFDPYYTIFVLAMGPIYHHITGCVQIAKFDIRGNPHILDPSLATVVWDNRSHQLISKSESRSFLYRYANTLSSHLFQPYYSSPTEMISSVRLGSDVSCMIHFKYPPFLNHLICTGSSQDDELSVYDWRFGLKVGSLPWKSTETLSTLHHPIHHEDDDLTIIVPETIPNTNDVDMQDEDDETVETMIDVRPWGLESTLVVPPYWNSTDCRQQDLAQHGFRLIAVGDNRGETARAKLEVKVWDISYLLKVRWDPLANNDDELNIILSEDLHDYLGMRFKWWSRRTPELTKLALRMVQRPPRGQLFSDASSFILHHYQRHDQHFISSLQHYPHYDERPPLFQLPYSPPPEEESSNKSVLLSHTFDKGDQDVIPVKYTAYNVLHTSLFLLTEDGKVTVMDIETGEVNGTVDNVAEHIRVKGIDVNVIGGKEVVVTSKEGLLRGIVS